MLIATLSLACAPPALAAEVWCDSARPHPIDIAASKRLDSAVTTVDIRAAQGEAHIAWDKELNRVYRELMRGLDKDSAARLKKTQKAWLAYRDAEVDWLWSTALYGDAGTSGPVSVSGAGTELVRQRTCELNRHIEVRRTHGR
jgi:uncharacterized protein YecT (DUF1311 family)